MGETCKTDGREDIDCERLAMTLDDEEEHWYRSLVGDMVYDNLLDLYQKHLKKGRVCERSKRWWNKEIAARLAVVRDHCRRDRRNGEWMRERYRLHNMIQEEKWKCWENFCR